ncbi:hypothetical protein NC651_015475 [Populus alba x Populus x berolinensis]|nr:hypothetical protein NC651_015475 [Populus alba x Populus x berolinensis]
MKGSRDFNPSNSGEVKGHIITEPTPARNRIGCEEALVNFHQWKYPKHAGGLQVRTEAANWCFLSSSIPVQQTTLFLKQKYEQLEVQLLAIKKLQSSHFITVHYFVIAFPALLQNTFGKQNQESRFKEELGDISSWRSSRGTRHQ